MDMHCGCILYVYFFLFEWKYAFSRFLFAGDYRGKDLLLACKVLDFRMQTACSSCRNGLLSGRKVLFLYFCIPEFL